MESNLIFEARKDDFILSTDKTKLNITVIHNFLKSSYWAKDIEINRVEKCIQNSICFGLYHNHQQVGFSRVISDLASFAYLADVFIIPEFRNRGLAKWMIKSIVFHAAFKELRRFLLATKNAHNLYERHGFKGLKNPEFFLEKVLY